MYLFTIHRKKENFTILATGNIMDYHIDMKIIFHALLLTIAFGLVFIWEQSPLADFTVQGLALLVLFYLVITIIRKKRNPKLEMFGSTSDIFILTTAILLLINITGNLYSPLFFLLYFLGFGITFIFEPISVFLFTIGTVLIFLPQALKNNAIESYIRLGSIVLISPLAYFFGQEYNERIKQEQKTKEMDERLKETANVIAKDIEILLTKEEQFMKDEDVEKINEILEETEELREESKGN